jgi:hypothetical protein
MKRMRERKETHEGTNKPCKAKRCQDAVLYHCTKRSDRIRSSEETKKEKLTSALRKTPEVGLKAAKHKQGRIQRKMKVKKKRNARM